MLAPESPLACGEVEPNQGMREADRAHLLRQGHGPFASEALGRGREQEGTARDTDLWGVDRVRGQQPSARQVASPR